MNLEKVKQFLEENKESEEVKEYLNSFKVSPTLEVFKDKLVSDSDFRSFIDSEKDRHSSKALETWKSNNLKSLIDEKIKELYPSDDPKDLEIKQMKQELEDIKRNALRKELTNTALNKAVEMKLPTELVEFFVGADEETTLKNLQDFDKAYNTHFDSALRAKLEGNGDKVYRGEGNQSSIGADLAKNKVKTQGTDEKNHYFG